MMGPAIARLFRAFEAHNAINVRTVDIYIQSYPGKPDVNRGIPNLEYKVKVNNLETQSGKTGNNGKISVRIPAGSTPVLEVMGTKYQISSSNAAFENVNTTKGKKERLRYLGYQIGHEGTDGNGVDNEPKRYEYDRSVLDFQADHKMDLDANPASIESDLVKDAGG